MMKQKLSLATLAFFAITTVRSLADEAGTQRLKDLDQKIAELKSEKAKILAKNAPSDSTGISEAQGQMDPRILNSVLLIEGDQSTGIGFVASTGGKKYVYTSAAVLSGNLKLTIRNSAGITFKKFGDLEAAEDVELVRMEITEDVKDFLEFRPAQPPLQINQKIAIFGKYGGNGSVAPENGLLLGTSAETLEVDARNSKNGNGGPIVDIATGKIVGMTTRTSYGQEDVWSEGTRQGQTRRFACRLDREWTWKTMKIGKFLADGKALGDHLIATTICYNIMSSLKMGCSYSIPSIGPKVRDPIGLFPDNEMVKAYNDFMANLKVGSLDFPNTETKKKVRNLLVLIYSKVADSKDSVKSAGFAWYHRIRIDSYIESREKCIKCVNRGLEEMK
jgi:hypothetical protein